MSASHLLSETLTSALGAPTAAELLGHNARVNATSRAPTADALARVLRLHDLSAFPALLGFERVFGGLEHDYPEDPSDESAMWQYGAYALLHDAVPSARAFWPRGMGPDVLRSASGLPLVPVISHPDGTLFLGDDGGLVAYFPFRDEVVRMSDSPEVYLRRQFGIGWTAYIPHSHQSNERCGHAWAGALGLAAAPLLSDSLERWWLGEGVALRELTRTGAAILRKASYDQGFDGECTTFMALAPEPILLFRAGLGRAQQGGAGPGETC